MFQDIRFLSRTNNETQNPKIYNGDIVRNVKEEKAFRKSYKQSFTDEIFEIKGIPTLNPSKYSLVNSDNEPMQAKFYQPELQIVRLPLFENVQQLV